MNLNQKIIRPKIGLLERYWTEKSRQKNNNFVSHFCIFQAAICS